jgi:hypothetical protein
VRARTLLYSTIGLGAAWLLAFSFLNSGFVRDAGLANSLDDLEGDWVLDSVRGSVEPDPPERIRFSKGAAADLIQIDDGERVAEFQIQGAGRWAFADGVDFSPLVPPGARDAYTMTHFCPPVPQWDHLTFFPTGLPVGRDPERRFINYERE